MPTNLTLLPTKPVKSSKLALPPSPFSPRFPISPPPKPATTHARATKAYQPVDLPPAPSDPLHWLWQCHVCNRVYQLGVTRRCLDDGHFFCSGTTTVKKSKRGDGKKKVVRHRACASEFDYAGWKLWGKWRREVAELAAKQEENAAQDIVLPLFASKAPSEEAWFAGQWAKKVASNEESAAKNYWAKDCWGSCDYPSECRWGKQYGVATPVPPSPPPKPTEAAKKAKTTFDELLLTIPDPDASADAMQSPPLSPDAASVEEPTRQTTFDDLLESAKRRKRRSSGAMPDVPSPLATHPPSPTTISMAQAMDLAGSSEHVEHATTSHDSDLAGQSALQKAFDDFDLDLRSSLGRAGAALTGFVSSVRSTTALDDDKAEGFVKGLRVGSRREKEKKNRG